MLILLKTILLAVAVTTIFVSHAIASDTKTVKVVSGLPTKYRYCYLLPALFSRDMGKYMKDEVDSRIATKNKIEI